jgi:hypothetical protein
MLMALSINDVNSYKSCESISCEALTKNTSAAIVNAVNDYVFSTVCVFTFWRLKYCLYLQRGEKDDRIKEEWRRGWEG